jgi:hypothetical protein
LVKSTVGKDTEFIGGMTVKERLFHFELIEAFESAVRSGRLAAVVDVLRNAMFSESQALASAEAVLASPEKYGLPSVR